MTFVLTQLCEDVFTQF